MAYTAATSSSIVDRTLGPFQAVASSSSSSSSAQPLENSWHGSFTASSPLRFRPLASSGSLWSLLPSRSSPFCRRSGNEVLITRMMLPSQYREQVSSPEQQAKIGRWSARAIKSFSMAELEARKLKYPTTGTETLLMGILTEGVLLFWAGPRESCCSLLEIAENCDKLLEKAGNTLEIAGSRMWGWQGMQRITVQPPGNCRGNRGVISGMCTRGSGLLWAAQVRCWLISMLLQHFNGVIRVATADLDAP